MAALIIVGSAICVGVGAVTGAVVFNSILMGLGLGVVCGWALCGAGIAYGLYAQDVNAKRPRTDPRPLQNWVEAP